MHAIINYEDSGVHFLSLIRKVFKFVKANFNASGAPATGLAGELRSASYPPRLMEQLEYLLAKAKQSQAPKFDSKSKVPVLIRPKNMLLLPDDISNVDEYKAVVNLLSIEECQSWYQRRGIILNKIFVEDIKKSLSPGDEAKEEIT